MMRACLSAQNEGTQKYFLKTAFYGTTNDKYIADQTSSIKPVEAASAVTSNAVGIQLGCNFSSFRSAEAYDDQWIIVGTIQATLPCDLETFRCRLTWLGMLALDKTEHKSRSPNRAFPEMGCSKSACSTGHYRQKLDHFWPPRPKVRLRP